MCTFNVNIYTILICIECKYLHNTWSGVCLIKTWMGQNIARYWRTLSDFYQHSVPYRLKHRWVQKSGLISIGYWVLTTPLLLNDCDFFGLGLSSSLLICYLVLFLYPTINVDDLVHKRHGFGARILPALPVELNKMLWKVGPFVFQLLLRNKNS